MIDLGISKIALIGAVALIVIGPEKLPRLARTVGMLLGKAQRYVNDVKQEVNRSMELDEFKKMKDSVQDAARDVENSIRTGTSDFEKSWSDSAQSTSADTFSGFDVQPEYRHPQKKWRLKRGATPQWFKARSGIRTKAQSGAARVARFRPQPGRKA